MNRRRLPPQPTDTRLARFVGRLVGRLYRARIWAVQNSPVVRRDVPAVDLHPYTKVVLEDQARSIAMRHAEEVAAAIVQQVVPSGLRSAGGGK